jgi:hypothetical protein
MNKVRGMTPFQLNAACLLFSGPSAIEYLSNIIAQERGRLSPIVKENRRRLLKQMIKVNFRDTERG